MQTELLNILNTIQPLGWPAALIVFILYGLPKIIDLLERKWITKVPSEVELKVNKMSNHDMSEIKTYLYDIKNLIGMQTESLKRMEFSLTENNRDTAYIKGRIEQQKINN